MQAPRSTSFAPARPHDGNRSGGPAPLRRLTRRVVGSAGAIAAIAGIGVVAAAPPAGAVVTVATSGTTMTVTLTGAETLDVKCVGGVVSANTKTGSPTVPCATFSKITVNGDSAKQEIDGADLEIAAFAAKPVLVADLGDGPDIVDPTSRADDIDMGPGEDRVYVGYGVTDVLLDGGAGTDYIALQGADGVDDAIVASSTNANLAISHEVNGVLRTNTAKNFETTEVGGRSGNDTLDLSGITTSASIKDANIYGQAGDDIVRGPQFAGDLFAGPGNNQIFGGPADDNIGSEGNGDVIKLGGGAGDRIYDRYSGRSGRTSDSVGSSSWYFFEGSLGDTTSRVRPGAGGTATVTNSLTRTGQQTLGSNFKNVGVNFLANTAGQAKGLADVVALDSSRKIYARGDSSDTDIIDVTVPTGSWTTLGTPQDNLFITPTTAGLGAVQVTNFGAASIHGPWTNKNNGFVHRVTRDLMFRFATNTTVTVTGGSLTAGTTTRPAVVSGLMDTDEYRGLDVDRTFTRFLKREVDPSGRAYWINSIGSGKALWRFRAQLFGSNEYFTKAGGTNAAYLDKVYYDVLGRPIDPSGRTYWTNKLNSGADRGSVALSFLKAAEFRRFVVDDQFLRFLDRKATTQEHATWDPKITGTATGEQDLIASLVGSGEYFNRS